MKTHNIIILFLLVLNIIDYDTTVRIIEFGGSEANPIMNYVIVGTGLLWPLLAIKVFVMGIIWLGFYLVKEVTPYLLSILVVATLIYTLVVIRSVAFCMGQGLF